VVLKNKVMKDSSRKQFSAAEFISNEVTPVETRDGKKVVIFRVIPTTIGYIIDEDLLKEWRRDGTSYLDYTYDEFSTDLFFNNIEENAE